MAHAQMGTTTRRALRFASFLDYLARSSSTTGDIFPFDDSIGEVAGPDPDRVVVIGEATALGYGVRTHQLGVAAQFSRKLSAHTGRGAHWQTVALPGMRLRATPRLCAGIQPTLIGADFVILIVGIVDTLALTTTAAWIRQLETAVDTLLSALPIDARILITEIPPLSMAGAISPLARVASGHQSRVLNQATRRFVATSPRCSVVPFPPDLQQELWRPETIPATYAAMYSAWAGAILNTAAEATAPRRNSSTPQRG